MARTPPALARLSELFSYDPDTGVLVHRLTPSNRVKPGRPAGYLNHHGYTQVRVDGHLWHVHHIVWMLMTGEWPEQWIDHINGERSDNRWGNLRQATPAMNAQNLRTAHKDNSTGYLGVNRIRTGKFGARIMANGKAFYLGTTFETPEAAHAVYLEAKRRLHAGCTL